MKNALVIGSGFSSLSAACYLAKEGFNVTVIEKNGTAGGRARRLQEKGFTFDMGPTWYWMPDVFDKFFADFGRRASDYYSLQRLSPSYRIFFDKQNFIDLPVGIEAQCRLFESIEPGSSSALKKFIKDSGDTYRIAMEEMAYKPGVSPMELVSIDTITHLNLFVQSMRQYVKKRFNHPYIQKLLEFPVLFLGAKPDTIPAFYNFMNYADLALGTWYPEKGMYAVVEAMVSLAQELGVEFIFGKNIEKILVDGNRAIGISVNGNILRYDYIISGADYNHTESLLDEKHRMYSENYWSKKTFAPSALLFFVGVNKKLKDVLHHTLFFDEEFDEHAKAIYDNPQWPNEPLFYASFSSITDESTAPAGMENMTLLVPIAPGLEDTDELREKYFNKILSRLEKLTGQKIAESIVFKKSYCINDFIKDYNSFKGNAYGLANTLTQTAFLRPSIRSKKVKNLYFTGQLTVPGPGVPPSIISGKIAAGELLKQTLVSNYAD